MLQFFCNGLYTPQYIVDYIIENTVGKILEGKTPKEAKITIVDPACGAGVFLIGAYQYLLDWHTKHFGKLNLANRSVDGAKTQAVLMSVFQTLKQQNANVTKTIVNALHHLLKRKKLPTLAQSIKNSVE